MTTIARRTAAVVALWACAPACRGEYVVAVLEPTSTSSGEHETSTIHGGSSTGAATSSGLGSSDASSADSSSTDVPTCDDGASEGSDSTETTGPLPTCEAPMGHTVCDSDLDPMHALGLGCSGGAQESTPVIDPVVTGDPQTLAVATRFGDDGNAHFVPTEGSKLLVISTGTLDKIGDHVEVPLGRTYAEDGDNPNPDGALPEPIVPEPGSAGGPCGTPFVGCDGIGDCSESLPEVWEAGGALAHDLAWLRFDVAVPAGTFGYRVDLAWFTAEFPEAHAASASDLLVWWQSSERFTGNVATVDGAALTVANAGATIVSEGFVGNAPELAGTGFESTEAAACDTPWIDYPAGQCPNGGSTGWMTLQGPAHPGEIVTVAVALFDVGHANIDSAVVLDNWRWNCDGCTPGASCGLGPLQDR
ncbi:MAG: hypothetical protein IAG13_06755 [Deltaproteobacteria bacterium]|nr:hypothetical protein [Nannocystaceae bacterium]